MNEDRLVAKVRAVNKANAYMGTLYADLVKVFTPLVGQKIEKATGELLAKVEKLLPKFPSGYDMQVIRHRSDYSLSWTIRVCEMVDDHSCTYHEVTVYIGEMKIGILTGLCAPPCTVRTDYTVAEITEKREQYQQAKKEADKARDALYPFGEYDR